MLTRVILGMAMLITVVVPARAAWVSASESYAFPSTMAQDDACREADGRARAAAIRQVVGETVNAEDALRCSEEADTVDCARNSSTWTAVGGYIRAVRNRSEKVEAVPEAPGVRRCVVSLDADVGMAEGRPDPSFTVGVSLNANAVYRDGDGLAVTLKPSEPMFVQVFVWLPYEAGDAQVSRLFPNAFDTQARIEKAISIPSEAGAKRYDLKVQFPKGQAAGKRMVDEYLMVIATKTPVTLRDSFSLDDFTKAVAEIPQDQRRLVRRLYTIVRAGS